MPKSAAIDACQVGNPYTAPHDAARAVLAEGLIRLGVISQTVEEALDLESGELKVVHAQHQPLDWPRRSRCWRVQAGWFATLA